MALFGASLGAEPLPGIEARLGALRPDAPMAYFELGEEVASESGSHEERDLARRLYLLAYELDRAQDGALGRSVCLALGEIAEDDRERAMLAALARALGDGASPLAPSPASRERATGADDENAFALATALGHYRAGEYERAAAILARPEIGSMLQRYENLLGGAALLLREVNSKPSCRECRNARVVKADLDPQSDWRLCYTCGGDPGPGLDLRGLVSQLRVESMLLSGTRRSWSAQLVADGGEPLREVDPEELANRYAVDASRSVWRDGDWAAPENAPMEPAASPP
jgi:hypothetical protein